MRKLIAGFLATAMVASVGATMTLAASSAAFVKGTATVATGVAPATPAQAKTVVLKVNGSEVGSNSIDAKVEDAATAAAAAAKAGSFKNIEIDGRRFTVKVTKSGNDVVSTLGEAYAISKDAEDTEISYEILDADGNVIATVAASAFSDAGNSTGAGKMDADVSKEGIGNYDITDVVVCGPDGNPIPLTESGVGVGKDQNDNDGVQSGKTVYFMIKAGDYKFDNEDYWKIKISKGTNGKYVKAISDVTKKFGGDLVNAYNHQTVSNTGGVRHRYIKVELAELFTDDEYKITLDMRLSARSKAADVYSDINDDDEIKVSDFAFWMTNIVKNADNDWKVGIGGLMLSPIGNDWNEVTYYDEDSDVAYMKFFADSDVGKFYAKLSTKWEHEDYRSFFNDQDAFFFQFTGSPKISSTSRCDLQIYSPFVDEDGNETIDPETAVIYELIDGELVNVTSDFKYEEGENGDMAFTTRTRFLGTYIICEREVDLGDSGADAGTGTPTDVAPQDTAPTTPDAGNAGKNPPNTGRF